ncbi:malolactic regulator [Sporolactobacillus inulinus]|uniref:Malolactic regulator n=1 Tax=Sporolactobacillus inulinus TaxID=2078 RepID=A0A4Y1Z9N4_9BACL|nr:hypothetical protein [Sporolactobacillus inulinus]GAY75548.1 malolactic regulator [Sporolactobacillus inulinus]
MEKELDAQLIIRDQSHNALTFTDCGKQFAQHATQMLQELKTAQLEISAIKHERVRLGLPPIIGSALFPALSARLSQNNLLGHLDTHEDGSKSLLNQLKTDSSISPYLALPRLFKMTSCPHVCLRENRLK